MYNMYTHTSHIHMCVVSYTCGRLHVWSATCVVSYMCDWLHVWSATCMDGYMCGRLHVWLWHPPHLACMDEEFGNVDGTEWTR